MTQSSMQKVNIKKIVLKHKNELLIISYNVMHEKINIW